MQLLYHCNFGPPLLGAGSDFLAPAKEIAPRDATAETAMDESFNRYPAPTSGVIEQVYFYKLLTDSDGKTLAVLRSAAKDKACALRFRTSQLPCFTLWKNPGAESDGYVTGLEPGTNFPNHKSYERKQGRVVNLAPGASYDVDLDFDFADGTDAVTRLATEVDSLQAQAQPVIHRKVQTGWSV
jgi:galactose mutarotase-like enzyme